MTDEDLHDKTIAGLVIFSCVGLSSLLLAPIAAIISFRLAFSIMMAPVAVGIIFVMAGICCMAFSMIEHLLKSGNDAYGKKTNTIQNNQSKETSASVNPSKSLNGYEYLVYLQEATPLELETDTLSYDTRKKIKQSMLVK